MHLKTSVLLCLPLYSWYRAWSRALNQCAHKVWFLVHFFREAPIPDMHSFHFFVYINRTTLSHNRDEKMQSKRLACLLQYYYRSANVYKKQLPAI